ncbi:MAG: glutamate 5-kinase [Planctomycetota bacterium]
MTPDDAPSGQHDPRSASSANVGAEPSPVDESLVRTTLIESTRCVVVKVGTRVLTTADGKLDRERVDRLAGQLARIAESGRQTIMVSSGAVGAGVAKLGLPRRPTGLAALQAVAAIGQADLIAAYEASFKERQRLAAQVLLTKNDLKRRAGYLHVRNALVGIHELGAIAIINENDSVAVSELRTTFGDNDGLAAQVAGLFNDTLLVLLSDIDGLYDRSPEAPGARPISWVRNLDASIMRLASDSTSNVSKGGMTSKLNAAKLAATHGHATIIGSGKQNDILDQIMDGRPIGTLFFPAEHTVSGRRRWIGSSADVAGRVHVDQGAAKAISENGSSLLPVGIVRVEGTFQRGAVIAIVRPDGVEIGRGLTNYKSQEIQRIAGHASEKIQSILGHRPYENVVHRDNFAPN